MGNRQSAFTLIELLIVMAVITVVVALGIPLFGALTGAKSVESGQNLVAATIGAARTVAINENKYAGVLFYVDPATERTAMSIVIVADPSSGLEDPDPYDKYKAWVNGQEYRAPEVDGNGNPTHNDHAIDIAVDADATFRGPDYAKNPRPSTNLNLFGNYRPVVRSYRCTEAHTADDGNHPPRNGPYGSYSGSQAVPGHYQTLPSGQGAAPRTESVQGAFANEYWDATGNPSIERYSAEQQLLPRGVGVQVIVQQLQLNTSGASQPADRYLRTGVIMFDPQGRVTTGTFSLDGKTELGKYLGLDPTQTQPDLPSGLGIAVYNDGQFRDVSTNTLDDYTLASNPTAGRRSFNFLKNGAVTTSAFGALLEGSSPTNYTTANAGDEFDEEKWLDNNSTPLLVNRFSGALTVTE